jgi:hypothetical protein
MKVKHDVVFSMNRNEVKKCLFYILYVIQLSDRVYNVTFPA